MNRSFRGAFALCVLVACARAESTSQGEEASSSSAAVIPPSESREPSRQSPARTKPDGSDCGDKTISQARVGAITIGDPVEALKKCQVVRDTVVPADEGSTARKVFIANGPDTIAAEIVDGKVWRIEALSPGIRTADSLGVGTPLSRLLKMSNPRGLTGEGRMFVVSPDHCGESFQISYFGAPPRGGWTRAALAKLPEATHVTRVLVIGCHPEL